MAEQEEEQTLELPAFHALDARRVQVAADRERLALLLASARQQASTLKKHAAALVARDQENGYAEMWRKAIGAVK